MQFLLGKTERTDWHDGPMFDETKGISAVLTKINEMGLLTLSSQPGLFESAEASDTQEGEKNRIAWAKQHEQYLLAVVAESEKMEIRQRAFVECICLRTDGDHIVTALKRHGLWIHYGGERLHDGLEPVVLTTTNVITADDYEAIVVDTKARSHDSGQIAKQIFPDYPEEFSGLVIMDPLFRRNTLFDTIAAELAQLRSEGKINATLLSRGTP